MNILIAIVLLFFVLASWSSIKHRLNFRFKRTLIILAAFFLVLMLASAYFDMSFFFSKDNLLAKTGAAVFSDMRDALSDKPLVKEDTIQSIKGDVVLKMQDVTDNVVGLDPSSLVSKLEG